jgi:hypothetical protein
LFWMEWQSPPNITIIIVRRHGRKRRSVLWKWVLVNSPEHGVHVKWFEMTNATLFSICVCHPCAYGGTWVGCTTFRTPPLSWEHARLATHCRHFQTHIQNFSLFLHSSVEIPNSSHQTFNVFNISPESVFAFILSTFTVVSVQSLGACLFSLLNARRLGHP